jgi:HAD superfamily hydrolase (TIGR01509 family)
MIEWKRVRTVLLDMDGTLLDLHYDNHFWLSHVPKVYAEKHGLTLEASSQELSRRYQAVAGTMQWYCVDYWTAELDLDIATLKEEVGDLIAVHPHVPEFLAAIRSSGRRATLVTNAHFKSLSLKMRRTGLSPHFDAVICAHDIGIPKEHPEFWDKLQGLEAFDPESTLLIDDSLPVLRSARDYGIGQLLGVYQPDSQQPDKSVDEFQAIRSFREIMPESASR